VISLLETELNVFPFKYKEIWFSDRLYDVSGYDSVIFRECDRLMELPGFRKSDFTTLIIDPCRDEKSLWKDMSDCNCRKPINRAIKKEVTVEVNRHYEEFYDINHAFRKEKGLTRWDLSIDYMKKNGTLFVTEYMGEVLSGLFCLSDENVMLQLITASKRLETPEEGKNFIGNANKLMVWESIMYAKKNGMKTYDMGGYYTGKAQDVQKEKINVYKKSFGGEVAMRYIYRKNYSLPVKLVNGIGSIIKAHA
jgi:hypothetical protein